MQYLISLKCGELKAKKLCSKAVIKVKNTKKHKNTNTTEESFTDTRYEHRCYVESMENRPSYLLRQRYFAPPRLKYPGQTQYHPKHINMTKQVRKSDRAHQPKGIYE